MHRFFVDSDCIEDGIVTISGEDVAHITRVLRLKPEDEILVCDKNGTDYRCAIKELDREKVSAWVLQDMPSGTESNLTVTLYQGVPKGDKLDTVIQKCVELGAVRIVPVSMKRCVACIKDKEKKQQRMQKIAAEAAKQCGRGIIPIVDKAMDFKQALQDAAEHSELKLLPYENEKKLSIKTVLRKNSDAKNICILIGPEGGFAPEEVELAKSSGFESVTMGPRILRTETAPIAAISAVMYELGDW